MKRILTASLAVVAAAATFASTGARAEIDELRIAHGYSIAFMPLVVMDQKDLLEKHTAAMGMEPVPFVRTQVASSTTGAQAILSGSVHMISGGVPTAILLWDRTNGQIKNLGALSNMPMMLNTRDPKIKTLADYTENDRIAIPGVKTSIMALVLQQAAEKEFGAGNHDKLDHLTVARSLAQGSAEMLSGIGEIGSHFASLDYGVAELKDPKIHTVLKSEDVFNGSSSYIATSASVKFPEENPKVFKAFNDAVDESIAFINANKAEAAQIYKDVTGNTQPVEDLIAVISRPGVKYDRTPENFLRYAQFLHRIGTIDNLPSSWKDMVFENLHHLNGS